MAWVRFTQGWGSNAIDDVVDLPYPIAQALVEVSHRAEKVKKKGGKWVVDTSPMEPPGPECAAIEPPEKAVKRRPRKRKATKGATP